MIEVDEARVRLEAARELAEVRVRLEAARERLRKAERNVDIALKIWIAAFIFWMFTIAMYMVSRITT